MARPSVGAIFAPFRQCTLSPSRLSGPLLYRTYLIASMDFDLAVSRVSFVPSEITDEFADAVRKTGLEVAEEEREPVPYASLEWLIPTAVVVFMLRIDKYFEAFWSEAGKDHYQILRKALSKLVKRTTGPEKEVKLRYVASSEQKVSRKTPPTLSVMSATRLESRISFVFEDETPPDQQEHSVDRMLALLQEHHSDFPNDSITQQAKQINHDEKHRIVMRYGSEKKDWTIVDLRHRPGAV